MRLATRVAWIAAWTIALIFSPSNALAQDGCIADLNDDGVVNGTDLAIVIGGWGPCPVNTTFVGGVVKAGGVPVPGAMVTTDLGGKTVAGEGGIFLLEIELPSVIETVVLSATAEIDGVGFEGTKTVSPVNVGGSNLVGLIEVSSGGCDTGFAWLPTFAGAQGLEGAARAMATYDDGTGVSLYVAGFLQAAGGVSVNNIARWNGVQWSPLGIGVSGDVYSLAVFDSGTGPELYVGGGFSSAGGNSDAATIARWNGQSWSPVGDGVLGSVRAMCVFDDGSGPSLYVAGQFTHAGDSPAKNIARWNGSEWSPVGEGLLGLNSAVYDLCAFDDGTGPVLVAAGRFDQAGRTPAKNIAAWDGSSWSSLGPGIGDSPEEAVLAVAAYTDVSGPALYAGGQFDNAGPTQTRRVAKWQDGAWTEVGDGVSAGGFAGVVKMLEWDDGFGSDLYVAGYFTLAGALPVWNIARWDGYEWSQLGTGSDYGVEGLGTFTGSLFIGGGFEFVGGVPAQGIAQWGCNAP